jgi:hypothetical protein
MGECLLRHLQTRAIRTGALVRPQFLKQSLSPIKFFVRNAWTTSNERCYGRNFAGEIINRNGQSLVGLRSCVSLGKQDFPSIAPV